MGGWREQRVATQPAGPHSRSEGCGVWCALLMGDTKLPWDSVQFGLRLSPIQSDQRDGTSPSLGASLGAWCVPSRNWSSAIDNTYPWLWFRSSMA